MEDSNAAFFVVDDNAGVRAVVEPEGLTQGEARRGLEAACFQSSEAAFAEVLETGELRVFDSLLSGPSSDFLVLAMLGFTSVVAVPEQYEGQTVTCSRFSIWKARNLQRMTPIFFQYAARKPAASCATSK